MTAHTYSDVFVGELFGGDFCLEKEGMDIRVLYRKNSPISDKGPSDYFNGILNAVALIHGCHPFPVYREELAAGRIVSSWCQPERDIKRDVILPISRHRLKESEDGHRLFQCAAEFFGRKSDLAEQCSRALLLMREACWGNAAYEIKILAMCSILEGLLAPFGGKTMHDGAIKLSGKGAWEKAVCKLQLDWGNCFSGIYDSFLEFRNPLAHGFSVTPSVANHRKVFDAYSRISAGIYIVMAKIMGFRGELDKSALEGRETVAL